MLKLGLQLYTLRDYCAQDFVGTLKRVADMGFKAVEPAGFYQMRPSELRKVVEDLGMEICSSHSPWANLGNVGEAMDIANILGLNTIVCGCGPDNYKDLDEIKKTTEGFAKVAEIAKRNGFTLFQHNHYWEFERIDGKLKYEIAREIYPGMKYEIDCFWSTNKGRENPVEMLKLFAKDTILLHMKDGICSQQAANGGMVNGLLDMKIDLLPLGSGDLPIPELVKVGEEETNAKVVIVELDYCDSMNIWDAVQKSYDYMTQNNIAR